MSVLASASVRCGLFPIDANAMNVFANTVVTLSFKLYDSGNQLIEETDEPIAYLHGGHSGIFPKVEAALADKKVGDSVSVTLEPEDAFGDYDTDLMRIEPLDQLPPDVAVGGHLVAEQDGSEMIWRITGIAEGKAEIGKLFAEVGGTLKSIKHDYASFNWVFSGGDTIVAEGTSYGEHQDGPWRAGVPDWGAGRWCDVFEVRDFLIQRCFIYLDPDYAGGDTARYPWLGKD